MPRPELVTDAPDLLQFSDVTFDALKTASGHAGELG
jgi:hypothetical protein